MGVSYFLLRLLAYGPFHVAEMCTYILSVGQPWDRLQIMEVRRYHTGRPRKAFVNVHAHSCLHHCYKKEQQQMSRRQTMWKAQAILPPQLPPLRLLCIRQHGCLDMTASPTVTSNTRKVTNQDRHKKNKMCMLFCVGEPSCLQWHTTAATRSSYFSRGQNYFRAK